MTQQVISYGDFTGMSPLCQTRIARYADTDAPIDPDDPADWDDAQHQWAYGGHRLMQDCFEEGCDATRPVPLHGHDRSTQVFILQNFIKNHIPGGTT